MPGLVDVNVLLPLVAPQHPAHASAQAWFTAQQQDEQIFWAWPTQLGLLRLLSHPRVMGSRPLTPERALDVSDELASATGLLQAPSPPHAHGKHLRRLVAGRVPTPNLWTDAWLAALALSLDLDMITFDKGFRSFDALKLKLLQA